MATSLPISTSTPSFLAYAPFLAKNFLTPPRSDSFLEGPTLPFNKERWKGGRGGSNYVLTLGFNTPFPDFSLKNIIIKNVSMEKILGIVIYNNLNSKSYMKKICEKANQKLCALSRISELASPNQKKKIINSFINTQFTYCPLIWMFSSKGCYKRINKITVIGIGKIVWKHGLNWQFFLYHLRSKNY